MRVPPGVVANVFAAAERLSGDPLIGLHAAEHSTPRGPLLFLMLAEANLEASLRAWERYAPIPISSLRVHVDRGPVDVAMTFDVGEETLEEGPHVTEYLVLAVLRALVMSATGDLRPAQVEFRHPAHGDLAETERILRCPVVFGSERHAVVFHRHDVVRPSRLANPVIAQQVAAAAAAAARQATVHATWRERVADVTRALLVTGERADRASVARQLHTSEPSLHRALREEGTTFKTVRDTEVWSVARTLLANPQIKIEAVARAVGFADGASFAKAFKRHAGQSPRATGSRWGTRRRVGPRRRPECGAYPHHPDVHRKAARRSRTDAKGGAVSDWIFTPDAERARRSRLGRFLAVARPAGDARGLRRAAPLLDRGARSVLAGAARRARLPVARTVQPRARREPWPRVAALVRRRAHQRGASLSRSLAAVARRRGSGGLGGRRRQPAYLTLAGLAAEVDRCAAQLGGARRRARRPGGALPADVPETVAALLATLRSARSRCRVLGLRRRRGGDAAATPGRRCW